MKKLIYTFHAAVLLAAVVFTSSCSNDAEEDLTSEPVRFTSAVNNPAPITKASGTTWANGDAIGIYMRGVPTGYNADNRKHTTTGSSAFSPASGHEIYYPVNGENVDFVAYYPYNDSQSGWNYAVNVASQTNLAAIDLMWAKVLGKNKNSGNVPLTFDHKLTKVIFKTIAGEGLTAAELANMTVTIKGMNTTATFNLGTGALGAGSVPANIAPRTATAGQSYEAIVLPATFAIGDLTVEFALNDAPLNRVFTWTNNAAEVFEPSKEITFTSTISLREVGFTCEINNWIPISRNITAE